MIFSPIFSPREWLPSSFYESDNVANGVVPSLASIVSHAQNGLDSNQNGITKGPLGTAAQNGPRGYGGIVEVGHGKSFGEFGSFRGHKVDLGECPSLPRLHCLHESINANPLVAVFDSWQERINSRLFPSLWPHSRWILERLGGRRPSHRKERGE